MKGRLAPSFITRMISREKVISLAKEKIEALNYFLVDVEVSDTNEITIFFDKEEGVLVKDCLYLSRHIEENMDRNLEDYQLTVCSPGIDRALVVRQQYLKNIGRDVNVKTTDGDEIKGKLISFAEDMVIEKQTKQKKKREFQLERISIPARKIKETKLIIKFK